MELSLSVIKDLAVEAGALDFLIHFNGMLEDKVSYTNFSEFLEMNKVIRVEVFLVELVNYKANLMFSAKGRISALDVGLQSLINDLLFTWRADLIACTKTPATGICAKKMYDVGVLNVANTLRHMKPEVRTLRDVVVGLNDQVEIIVDRHTTGSLQLDIVSILGMPGIGK
ncbi:hypothetical protein ACH5RR_026583 [Cinchona calisaya]|uniref:Uncharacterized protein n=1 Tax=Cinchona calisaya TaxID=153742 RepID=A0ABD2Z4W1_9GENT